MSGSRTRAFVAVELPDRLRAELAAYAGRHPADGVRWLPAENLHVTVLFLGYLASDSIDVIGRGVAEACAAVEPFRLTLARIAQAPPGGRPRMVWAFFTESPAYAALASAVFDALRSHVPGAGPPRPHPHVTLARFARDARPRLALEEHALPQRIVPVDRCTLFASRPGPGGATYTPLAHAPLAG